MATVITFKQLAQRLPTTTATMVLYQPPKSTITTFIQTIIVCNTTGAGTTYSMWVNQNGSAVADQFALIKGISIAANASDQRVYSSGGSGSGIILRGTSASLLISSGAANALNFTLYGYEVEES